MLLGVHHCPCLLSGLKHHKLLMWVKSCKQWKSGRVDIPVVLGYVKSQKRTLQRALQVMDQTGHTYQLSCGWRAAKKKNGKDLQIVVCI